MKQLTAIMIGMLAIIIGTWSAVAQEGFEEPILTQEQPTVVSQRGIGMAVTFPLPIGVTTATVLLDLIVQGQLSPDIVNRLEVRFFFHFLSAFRADLTSLRESLLITFTSAPAVFYIGGGVGVFPIQSVPPGAADGFLFSLFARTGIEVQVAPLGLFLDVSYEPMPQPFADISTAGSLVTSAIELSVGALIHF